MCLAIGPAYAVERGPLGRLWWRLAGSPRRLFLAGALVQGAVLALRPAAPYPTWALLSGLAAALLLGLLLEGAPHWSGRSPIHYLRLVGAALPLNAGALALAALPAADAHQILAAALFAGGCIVALRALREHLPWMDAGHARAARSGALLTLLGAAIALLPVLAATPL